jgi:hypothetical protein
LQRFIDLVAAQPPQDRDGQQLVLVSELIERFDELVWAKHVRMSQLDNRLVYEPDKHQPLLLRLTWRQV